MLPDADPWERIHHVALEVPDLRAAERRYVDLFGMDVQFREVYDEADEELVQVPPERSWDETAGMGDQVAMSFVGRGGVVLAMHEPDAPVDGGGPVDHLNVRVGADELDRIEEQAPAHGCELEDRDNPYHTYVRGPSGVTWELRPVEG